MHPFAKSALSGLMGTALAVWVFEDWRGRHEWAQFLKAQTARGESFDYTRLLPPPVPSERNFAHCPQLRPWLDYKLAEGASGRVLRDPEGHKRALALFQFRSTNEMPALHGWKRGERASMAQWRDYLAGDKHLPRPAKAGDPAADVLIALGGMQAELAALAKAAQERPQSRFDVDYKAHFQVLLPHLAVLRTAAQALSLRALARLNAGDIPGAGADVELALFLAEAIATEPTLISHLVRIAIINNALQCVWEGLSRHQWTSPQLRAMQERLAGVDLLAHYQLAMLAERDFANLMMDEVAAGNRKLLPALMDQSGAGATVALRVVPEGWLRQNQARYTRVHMDYVSPIVDVNQRRMHPDMARRFDTEIANSGLRGPYNLMMRLLMPALGAVSKRCNATQGAVDQALIACALERHAQEHARLPETLEALVPRWLPKVPQDLVAGKPMKFEPQPGGGYRLYAVGWNQKDDGGQPGVSKAGKGEDLSQGDLVWLMPGR